MLLEKDIEKLKFIHYNLPSNDKNNHIAFIKGYMLGQNDEEFVHSIDLYLNKVHQIDIKYTTFIERVDHYAFMQGEKASLLTGFYSILEEFFEQKDSPNINTKNRETIRVKEEPKGKLIDSTQLKDGTIIKLGQYIQLSDKIGEDYKQTKFYDASLRNPSWNLFYPSEKDFKHIYFYLPEENEMGVSIFGRVRRLFSHTIDKIKSIRIHDNKIIAYTDNFKIDVDEALKQKEFIILNHQNANIKPTNLSSLKERFLHYTMGLMTLDELFDNCTFLSLSIRDKSWRRYERSMSRRWYEIKK